MTCFLFINTNTSHNVIRRTLSYHVDLQISPVKTNIYITLMLFTTHSYCIFLFLLLLFIDNNHLFHCYSKPTFPIFLLPQSRRVLVTDGKISNIFIFDEMAINEYKRRNNSLIWETNSPINPDELKEYKYTK